MFKGEERFYKALYNTKSRNSIVSKCVTFVSSLSPSLIFAGKAGSPFRGLYLFRILTNITYRSFIVQSIDV